MTDDFDRIKSALADIARAVKSLKMHPPRDAAIHLDRIAHAADAIKRHVADVEHDLALATLEARRRKYAP
jgi:hypothetical protein